MKICTFPGCGRAHRAKGLCQSHYVQQNRGRGLAPIGERSPGPPASSFTRNDDGLKKCTTCQEWLAESEYTKHGSALDGLLSNCKVCVRVNRHGVTRTQWQAMMDAQGGTCQICNGTSARALAIDHDHNCCPGETSCGKCVRALLCGPCNIAIGLMRDNPEQLRKAATYLEGFK